MKLIALAKIIRARTFFPKSLLLSMLLFYASPVVAQIDTIFQTLEVEAVYSSLPWYNSRGGLESGFVYMDNADITARIDFDDFLKLNSELSVFAYGLGNHGGRATNLMGDFQVASNIEAIDTWRLFELWVQWNTKSERLSALFGLYDLNSEFDILDPGTLFINSSFGIGAEYAQSGLNGPSIFPISSLALRMAASLSERLQVRLGIFDAVPGDPSNLRSNAIKLSPEEGALISAEASIFTNKLHSDRSLKRVFDSRRRKVGRGNGHSQQDKINFGGWYYTAQFNSIRDSSISSNTNFGVYLGAQKYYSLGDAANNLAVFGRLGYANPTFNRFGLAISGGMVLRTGFLNQNDQVGIAFSSGINGSQFQAAQENSTESVETVLELTYSYYLNPWLLLQPDVQYVLNPSTRQELENPLSFALLVQLSVFEALYILDSD